jgi:hypothetical protein
MGTWTTARTIGCTPEDLMDVLTDPAAARRWAPIDFEVEHLDGDRLATGGRARVTGRLAGVGVAFDVEVSRADAERLLLEATGPVAMDVDYELIPHPMGSEVRASVSVHSGRGFTGRLLAQATDALLAGGALQRAVDRIARDLEREPALAA